MNCHFISTRISRFFAALLLCAGCAHAGYAHGQLWSRSKLPDPVSYGTQVEMGNLPQVRDWLNAGLDPDFVADRIGTGLMIAAWRGDLPMMELLVARGADVNRANVLGERALMHAAWRGQLAAVRWLLAKGARINAEPMRWSPLHYAVFAGHGEVANFLLDRGADINARIANGSSVLMMAVYEGHDQLVRQLVARGADRSVKNDRGEGALEWAFKFERLDVTRLLGTPQEFAVAANKPKAQWGTPRRSMPELPPEPPPSAAPAPVDDITAQIDDLVYMRDILAARGVTEGAGKLDRRIAALRFKRARAELERTPAAVLEISASRAAPGEQRMRLIFGSDGPSP